MRDLRREVRENGRISQIVENHYYNNSNKNILSVNGDDVYPGKNTPLHLPVTGSGNI